ncbi:intracellular hyaluronan-binding protein 4 isoform X1 [Electrophorus electricus]|uniref:intracellular hyaluronan-binding protein 4 isoform X1 n=1 Tax=Electrophorus electricus TaxID=8005 RepID=UPI0015D0B63A|nr:intracellular hyaluronan-binding protein 4 isoform X1 [Electrophorus electricus]
MELLEEMPDTGYGCAVTNRFGQLFDDESDPFDVLYQAQVEKEQKKKKDDQKKTAVSSAKTGKKESQRERKTPCLTGGDVDSAAHVRGTQGPKRPVRAQAEGPGERRAGLAEPRFNDGENSLGYSIERPLEAFDRAGRGRSSGRGRGARGGYPRSTDGFDPRGKREFERHSGSDRASVRPEEKRGGSGPRNWGSMRDHVSRVEAAAAAVPNEESGESEEVPETSETDAENGPLETEEVIEVAIEMTLDEWKALQEQSKPKTEFNIRKADTKVPPKAVVIHKSRQIEEHADDISEENVAFRRPANDITFQMEINFGSLARPTRGGRGGRGGRVREVAASQRSPQKFVELAPNPDDPEDFPALT